MPKFPTWVVKLGGSLARGSTALPAWLATLDELSHRARIVIVAGGGPFADTVRSTQAVLRIDDATAHAMAVLGMRQFALAIDALIPRAASVFVTVDSLPERTAETGLMVWDPADPALSASDLPADWTATSDSIAAWLGGRIAANGTVLVKSRQPADGARSAPQLAAEAYIDAWLPELLHASKQPVWWLERSATGEFEQLVDGAALPERVIVPSV